MEPDNSPPETFGPAVAARRRSLGLSQEELADRAEIKRQYVSTIETGKQVPTLGVARRLAEALETTVGALLGETEPPPPVEDPRIPALSDGLAEIADRVQELTGKLKGAAPEPPRVIPFPPRLENVDEPRDVHTTPMPVVAYVAAGEGRHLSEAQTDDLVEVLNSTYREATDHGWKATRVKGDSMEPTYCDGDIVLIQPATKAKTKDHVLCSFNGDVQVKELRIAPRTRRITLLPHNLTFHDPIPVMENDTLEIIGIVRALAHRAVSNGKK